MNPQKHNPCEFTDIIWDWNGTLFNDVDLCIGIMNNLLKKRNKPPIDTQKYLNIFRFPVRGYYEDAGIDFSDEDFSAYGAEFMSNYNNRIKECQLYPDTHKVLSFFQNLGHLIHHKIKEMQHILSAYKKDTLDNIIDRLKLRDYFTFIVGSDNIYAWGKIDQGIYLKKLLDTPSSQVLFIGDTDHDLLVANHMEVKCLLIANGHQSYQRLSTIINNPPWKVIHSLGEIDMSLFSSNQPNNIYEGKV